MDLSKYQKEASATFKDHQELPAERARLLDWMGGLAEETGEVCGLIVHEVFHDQDIDVMTKAKELGDVLWYLSSVAKTWGIDLGLCALLNIEKLRHRHQGTFSTEGSNNRHAREIAFEQTAVYRELERRIRRDAR